MQKLCCEGGNVFSDAQSYAGSYVDYAESYAALSTTAARYWNIFGLCTMLSAMPRDMPSAMHRGFVHRSGAPVKSDFAKVGGHEGGGLTHHGNIAFDSLP